MRKDGNTKRLAKHIVLILGAVIMLVPFIWMFLTAFKTETEATQMNPFVIFLRSGGQTPSRRFSGRWTL